MGIIYIMWNIPFVWKIKIGITTTGKTRKRVKSVSRTTPGIVFPIFFSVLPFGVHTLEKDMHKLFRKFRMTFNKGSGKTEWFFAPIAIPAILLITLTTIIYWSPFLICIYVLLINIKQ